MKMQNKPLILFIDAYDSFANNIISLLETTLNVSVRTVKIDDPALISSDVNLYKELKNYVAVVCGPGPGSPENQDDIGLMKQIYRLKIDEILPVLGICLGFQSLCLEFGGKIKRLKGPQHGIVRKVTHNGNLEGRKSIFDEVGQIFATLYQSLSVDIGHSAILLKQQESIKWESTDQCPNLLPLAWVEHDLITSNHSGIKDERILVAVKHNQHPFWALQFHPESICTNDESRKIIQNWFTHATDWNRNSKRKYLNSGALIRSRPAIHKSLLDKNKHLEILTRYPIDHITNDNYISETRCFTRKIKLPNGIEVPDIVERTQDVGLEHILLESSNAHQSSSTKGRFSIIGLEIPKCKRIEYTAGQNYFKLVIPQAGSKSMTEQIHYKQLFGDIWSYIAAEIEVSKVRIGHEDSPFWGGFIGYTTYELGLESIGLNPNSTHDKERSRPDLCFVWVNSSIIIDHLHNYIYIQRLAHISEQDDVTCWIKNIIQKLNIEPVPVHPKSPTQITQKLKLSSRSRVQSILPDESEYLSKILSCQSYIRAGLSYELCLTDQTVVHVQDSISSWDIYKRLRLSQPAPYASYIRLGSSTFVSASPEQFLKWDESGRCDLRPMKGTVKKSSSVKSVEDAALILQNPKEKAENLMIVDLIRHDLYGVCGPGNVTVPRLMVIEEYASVFQMTSIVSGQIPPPSIEKEVILFKRENGLERKEIRRGHTGLDVLASSLPPGSMTGAPKKKSCEILKSIEGKKRGLYSGVVGYIDVRGKGNWSVNIRCLFKWDDEVRVSEYGEDISSYYIGAGGAITTLSTSNGEKEEMLAKLYSTLNVFKD